MAISPLLKNSIANAEKSDYYTFHTFSNSWSNKTEPGIIGSKFRGKMSLRKLRIHLLRLVFVPIVFVAVFVRPSWSLRFSAMRDGLEDYEYLWVLENKISKIKEGIGKEASWLDPRQRPLELCRRVVWSFYEYTRDADVMLDTRNAIAREIEKLTTKPLLIVQTSPPEGTVVPAGPRNIGVRGLVQAGAKVTLNGKPVRNVRPSGYFLQAYFMPANNPTITITVEHNGKKCTAERVFKLID